jgi:CubicO group peptidase (beta-lactamase class C family)
MMAHPAPVRSRSSLRRLAATALVTLATACGESASPAAAPAPVGAAGQADWANVAPAAVGLDAAALEAARAYGFRDEFYTQAILVARHGYLAAEWYAEGSGPDALGSSWSVAKSITATLIGQAIADGHIASVDAPMTTFIPEWSDAARAQIRLRDVLAMSSGLDWVEDYEQLTNDASTTDVVAMVLDEAPLRVAIDQPAAHPPGEVWNYSSGDTMLLGRVLRQATGKTAADLVQEKLALPMHFRDLHWWRDAAGETYTFCCVDATARDFLKFGQLYLQRGVWGGRQLVPAAWIDTVTAPQARANPGYGFQWWLNHPKAADGYWPSLPATTYFALGHNGQYVAVFPELDLVVVRLGQYIVPKTTDWVARVGLFGAGVFSDNLGPTGTRAPEGDWNDDRFFALVLAAVQE